MSSANILPLMVGGAAAVGAAMFFGGSGAPASSAPKHHQLARRNSDLAASREGAEIRRITKAGGASGNSAQSVGALKAMSTPKDIGNIWSGHPSHFDDAVREVNYWFN